MSGGTRRMLGMNVFDAAVDRMVAQYEQGHRIVVSTSGGKDSTCVLEVCLIAAEMTGRLPVEAVTRDEEIVYPGTFEYLDRVWHRPDVELHHLVAHHPIVNSFNRHSPYWWTFDPRLDAKEWVREPPDYAEEILDINIEAMTTKERFPVDEEAGQKLIAVIGLRVQESRGRRYGLHSSGGYMTKPHARTGVYGCRPIYDWNDGDVWHAIRQQGWEYSTAYDVMNRAGVSRSQMRTAPPSSSYAVNMLPFAAQSWPQWWDKVCRRLPGMQSAAQYGKRVLQPNRRHGETWEQTFWRECVEKAPEWIADRAVRAQKRIVTGHAHHSTAPLPQVDPCYTCSGNNGCWKTLATTMYLGDPFSMRFGMLPYVEPSFFWPDAPTKSWNGGSPG